MLRSDLNRQRVAGHVSVGRESVLNMPVQKGSASSPPAAGPGSRARARDLHVTVPTSGRALGGMQRGSSRMVAYDNWLHAWYVEKPPHLTQVEPWHKSTICACRQTVPACRTRLAPAEAAAPRARVRNGSATYGARRRQAHPPPRLFRVAWEAGHAGAVVAMERNHGLQMLVFWRAILPRSSQCYIVHSDSLE